MLDVDGDRRRPLTDSCAIAAAKAHAEIGFVVDDEDEDENERQAATTPTVRTRNAADSIIICRYRGPRDVISRQLAACHRNPDTFNATLSSLMMLLVRVHTEKKKKM
jgi:hypothetical protein